MNDLSNYISEKLRINKNSSFLNRDKLYGLIKDTIEDWFESHSWFDMDKEIFKMNTEENGDVSVRIPMNSTPRDLVSVIGQEICKEIEKKNKLDIYWTYEDATKDYGKLYFSDSIV